MRIINFKKKKLKLLTKEQQESYKHEYVKDKKYCNVRDHWNYTGEYRGVTHSKCDLKYSVPQKFL